MSEFTIQDRRLAADRLRLAATLFSSVALVATLVMGGASCGRIGYEGDGSGVVSSADGSVPSADSGQPTIDGDGGTVDAAVPVMPPDGSTGIIDGSVPPNMCTPMCGVGQLCCSNMCVPDNPAPC